MDSFHSRNDVPSYKKLNLNKSTLDLTIFQKTEGMDIPLSFAQERLWFLEQLDPKNPVHNISSGLKFRGRLNVSILERSVNKIVACHEILRTIFLTKNDNLVQQVLPELTVPILKINLRQLNAAEQHKKIEELIAEDIQNGFYLFTPPLIRFTLLVTGTEEYILLITTHQIICDEISLNLLIQELSKVYSSFIKNADAEIPYPAIQFAEYSCWQRQWIKSEFAQQQLDYWIKHLNQTPGIQSLPTDRPRPAIQSFYGSVIECDLDDAASTKLKSLCSEEDATLLMGLLTAFDILLHRYTGEEDILVGSTVTGRTWEQTESLIGLLANTVVIRTNFSGNPTFRELLRRVREECIKAFSNQDVPIEKLIDELHPERTLSHSPLFQIMFSPRKHDLKDYEFPDLQVERIEIENPGAKLDLTLEVKEEREQIKLVWRYSSDLFEPQTIENLSQHFLTMISSIIDNFDQNISQVNLLTEEEKRHLIFDLNQTESPYPRDSRIEKLFQDSVDASPKSTAVIFGSQKLTYGELDRRSNQLARYLMQNGIGPGKVAAIFMNRSVEIAVGLLGILKSGACYLPIDPVYLSDQVQFMLKDSGASIVLSQESIADKLHALCPIFNIDSDWKSVESHEASRFSIQGDSTSRACIIYTSGSTGIPKGVQVTHRNLVNHAFAIIRSCGLKAGDRVLQFASIAFDQAAEELYPTWFTGASVILRSIQMVSSFVEFLKQLEKYEISVLNLPTIYWHELTQEIQASSLRFPSCIRIVIVGGEKASFSTYKQWQQIVGDTSVFFNTYGPTETTVTSTIYEDVKRRTVAEAIQDVPIGRPIANTRIYILDQQMQLVPKGVPGELCVAGDGVTRGYLNRPELTASKFPKDPFFNNSEEHIYRTGDTVRYLPDGAIQFLGRRDNQVKILGYRIELGEVETALANHEGVRETVVTAPVVAARKQLVAYIVPHNKSLTSANLKDFLKRKLTDYMIPNIYIFLEQFPMTTSGKVDRKALPVPDEIDLKKTYAPPRNELETQLVEIWQKILNVSKIGVNDNFFDLGGHSLLAARLFTQIEKLTGKVLPLATLFQAPTIEQLATILNEERWKRIWSSLVSIQPYGNKPPLFCIHAIDGNVIGYKPLAQSLDPQQPVYGLQARGLDRKQQPHVSVEEAASDYIREIKSVQTEGPYHLAGHSSGGVFAFEIARQLFERGEKVGVLAMLDTGSPGNFPLELRPDQYPNPWRAYSEIIRYHLKNILFSSNRTIYLRQQLRRLLKRVQTSVSLAQYQLNKMAGKPEPAASLRVGEAGFKAIYDYVPRYYHGEITLFLCTKRPDGEQIPSDIGWRPFARSIQVRTMPGDHISILKDPDVQLLAKSLQECLDKSSEKKEELQKVVKVSLLTLIYHVANFIGSF